ncbi:hypothetical protein [Bradyrhizobium zhanjiangense]|uniref:hypothetical protein n=1 Tax=Bradyrhizobium zhanjiangense TaxID=1325107 RepID=UPI0010087AD4|nr:hypothetical protein [Bradyrhizobium zhanjiangense]
MRASIQSPHQFAAINSPCAFWLGLTMRGCSPPAKGVLSSMSTERNATRSQGSGALAAGPKMSSVKRAD